MTETEIIQKVKDYLDRKGMSYLKDDMGIWFEEKVKHRDGREIPMYTVSFDVGPLFSEYKLYFMKIDGATFELLYIMTPHGYLEIDH